MRQVKKQVLLMLFQITCKLFVLEKGTQSWTERGRGVLRLNDLAVGTGDTLQSRIVMRHQGSLKVILNTKLWPHTHLRRPARRSLQFSATDLESHTMRVFLVQGGARDVARLFVAIHHRLVALRGAASQHYCTESEEEEEEEEGAVTKTCMQTGERPHRCPTPTPAVFNRSILPIVHNTKKAVQTLAELRIGQNQMCNHVQRDWKVLTKERETMDSQFR
ncbi:hypothetical protein Z043_123676 [Scleropages formosus]|uniref:RanBD1 domain-containing protein n=1 Tax=Scleropages formosus TaxID=113540 RepID=A0A0P7UD96_SCLFO|nr:hypothetical protein Z043_123676 [Scleropages formosus]